jgi:uncharacterized protein
MSILKDRMNAEVKSALKVGDKLRSVTLRGMLAALKQVEVDERIELDETAIIGILTKLTNQRRDSITQFDAAQRQDLADKERLELKIIEEFLPTPLSADEVSSLITETIAELSATQIKDMGKVMNALRPQLIGRADIAAVSATVKARLSGS